MIFPCLLLAVLLWVLYRLGIRDIYRGGVDMAKSIVTLDDHLSDGESLGYILGVTVVGVIAFCALAFIFVGTLGDLIIYAT